MSIDRTKLAEAIAKSRGTTLEEWEAEKTAKKDAEDEKTADLIEMIYLAARLGFPHVDFPYCTKNGDVSESGAPEDLRRLFGKSSGLYRMLFQTDTKESISTGCDARLRVIIPSLEELVGS